MRLKMSIAEENVFMKAIYFTFIFGFTRNLNRCCSGGKLIRLERKINFDYLHTANIYVFDG